MWRFPAAFCGLRKTPGKYVNSPETAIFKKGDVMFALDKARGSMGKSGKALLCEGQIDVIACTRRVFLLP